MATLPTLLPDPGIFSSFSSWWAPSQVDLENQRIMAEGIDPNTGLARDPAAFALAHPGETTDQVIQGDIKQVDTQLQADTQFMAAQQAVDHAAAGGWLSDLFHPGSANVTPGALGNIPWKTILILLIAIVVLAGIHEVKGL